MNDSYNGEELFVNDAMDYALTMYTRSKERKFSPIYNSFLVVVIRALCSIYGKLDITNPFLTKNEYGFNQNLERFGYEWDNLAKFYEHMQAYYEWAKASSKSQVISKSKEFVLIQKQLIDMLACKIGDNIDFLDEEVGKLSKYLYTEDNPDPKFQLFNIQVAENTKTVKKYLNSMIENKKTPVEILGGIEKVKNLSKPGDEKDEVYRLIEADMKNEPGRRAANMVKPKLLLTSGSGFVDTILLVSIITTIGALIFIIAVVTGG